MEPTATLSQKPLPAPDALSAAFWAGAAHHRLVINYCEACARHLHPGLPRCPSCNAPPTATRELSGRGTVNSFTVVHDKSTRGFEGLVPYVVGIIELVEEPGLLLVSNIVACAPGAVAIGMPVQVSFEDVAEGVALPQFHPSEAAR